MTNKFFKIGLFNAGSLANNYDEFVAAMERHHVDIMAINETWLRQGEEGRAPVVPGYRLRHVPKPTTVRGGRGGGVEFYIKRAVNVRTHSHPIEPQHSITEQMWLVLSINGLKVAVGTAYRPPWQDVDSFLDAMTSSINSLYFCKNIILLGDFNINYLDQVSNKTKRLDIFLNCLNLTQQVSSATHFTDHSQTLIDLICTDASVNKIVVEPICALGGHAFISATFQFKKDKPTPVTITKRNLKDIDLYLLNSCLDSVDWLMPISSQDVDIMVAYLSDNLTAIFDSLAPVKTFTIKERCFPWITDTVKTMMTLRNEARATYLRVKSDSKYLYYKDLKQLVNKSLFHEKAAYFKYNINNNINNPRLLWKNLKSTVLPLKNNNDIPSHFKDPNELNSHFLNVPHNGSIRLSDLTYYEFHSFNDKTFSLHTVESNEIAKIIRTFKSNAEGYDKIAMDMFLLSLPQTLDILTAIVNTSILTSKFPALWKTAIVRPIPKTDNPTSMKDLRPISILPFLSKVLEKVINLQLTKYIELNNILPETQSGFRKGRSTSAALLDVTDDILNAQDTGMCTLLVLLDYSRAFDSINLSLLISKMVYYGFDPEAIKWFDSYLSHRSQFVDIRNEDGTSRSSSNAPVDKGVPQGSILAASLFNLYTSDIINAIKNCQYHIYADDTQIYYSFKPQEYKKAIIAVNEDLERLVEWSNRNSLALNPTKTKYMIFGTKKQLEKLHVPSNYHVKVMGEHIERVSEARNLGLLMDEELRFEGHIAKCVKNCFYRLKMLYNLRPYLSQDMRVQLAESVILSKLNYADIVFGPRLLSRTEKLLQRVQNACARFCFTIPPRTHITPFLNSHNMLKLKLRRKLHLASLLFGLIVNKSPGYLYSKITWVKSNRDNLSRRCAQQLAIPQHRSASFRGSFRYAASKCWNNIPPPVRTLKSVITFKHTLKRFLLAEQRKHESVACNLSII